MKHSEFIFRIFLISTIVAIAMSFALGTCWIISLLPPPSPPVTGHHISEFKVYGANLYFGAGYCLYRLLIAEKELEAVVCTENWTFRRPAVDGQRAYAHTIASPEPGLSFMAIDLTSGEVAWRSRNWTGEDSFRSIKDYTFVVNEKIYTAERDKVYSLDPALGLVSWQSDFNWMSPTDPFLIHDNLLWYPVVQDNDKGGELIAVDLTTGITQYTLDLRPEAYFDQLLYIDDEWIFGLDSRLKSSKPNHIFAVARADPSRVIWYSDNLVGLFGADQVFRYDNLLIVSETYKFVYALDITSGRVAWSFSPTEIPATNKLNSTHVAAFMLGSIIYGLDANSGQLIWKYQLKGSPDGGYTFPLMLEDAIYVGNVNTIDVLDRKSGRLLWQVPVNSEYQYTKEYP